MKKLFAVLLVLSFAYQTHIHLIMTHFIFAYLTRKGRNWLNLSLEANPWYVFPAEKLEQAGVVTAGISKTWQVSRPGHRLIQMGTFVCFVTYLFCLFSFWNGRKNISWPKNLKQSLVRQLALARHGRCRGQELVWLDLTSLFFVFPNLSCVYTP